EDYHGSGVEDQVALDRLPIGAWRDVDGDLNLAAPVHNLTTHPDSSCFPWADGRSTTARLPFENDLDAADQGFLKLRRPRGCQLQHQLVGHLHALELLDHGAVRPARLLQNIEIGQRGGALEAHVEQALAGTQRLR